MDDAPRQRREYNTFTREGRKAWIEGVRAQQRGEAIDDCPHDRMRGVVDCTGTKRSAWIAGWLASDNERWE